MSGLLTRMFIGYDFNVVTITMNKMDINFTFTHSCDRTFLSSVPVRFTYKFSQEV